MPEALKREIGFWGCAFLAFNGLVGAAIFALPGMLHTSFGAFAPWLFPIFGVAVLAIVLPFARIASHHERTGGPIVYAAPFGRLASFQAGWLYMVARVASFAANLNVLVTYAAAFAPPLLFRGMGAILIAAILAALVWVNVVGIRRAIRLLDLLTLLKAVPLILLALLALASHSAVLPSNFPDAKDMPDAALVILYAFVGFENAVVTAGETKDPRRTIPRALIATVLATALLYFIVQLAYSSVMPRGAPMSAPMMAFGERLLGPIGATLLTVTAIISVLGNVSGGITSTARSLYALGRDALLPSWFGRIDPRFATPANAILFTGLIVLILALTGSFIWLAVASVLARAFVYGVSIAALLRVEPGRRGVHIMAALGIAVCIWIAVQSSVQSWAVLLALAALGLMLYTAARIGAGRNEA